MPVPPYASGVYKYDDGDLADGTESGLHNLGQANLHEIVSSIRPTLNVGFSLVTFVASANHFGGDYSPVGYSRQNGIVEAIGTGIATAAIAAGATIFTFPAGFRLAPSNATAGKRRRFNGVVGAGSALFEVWGDGRVTGPAIASGTSFSIDGMIFRALG